MEKMMEPIEELEYLASLYKVNMLNDLGENAYIDLLTRHTIKNGISTIKMEKKHDTNNKLDKGLVESNQQKYIN